MILKNKNTLFVCRLQQIIVSVAKEEPLIIILVHTMMIFLPKMSLILVCASSLPLQLETHLHTLHFYTALLQC